ncbi:ABC transporter permease subunit [Streptomyces sp. NPDC047928]|uniref:ABC transporter permease subunit n=1 Tax=unclassified Streptomyces TaxID=2593676 RepID=UPI0037169811
MTAPHRQQAPYRPGGADAHPSYESPIAIRRAHLGDALASEWTKIRSVRSTMWTLGVMTVVVAGLGVLLAFLVAIGGDQSEPPAEETGSVLSLGMVGMMLGSVCVITLGVLTITSEFGTGLVRTTLTACPSRGRVLVAKSVVFFLLVFVLTTVVGTAVAMAQTTIVGTDGSATDGDWLRATVGVGLYMALLGLLSLAVGALLRHSAGAITTMIGLMLLPFVLAISMYTESLADLRNALIEYSIPNQLAVLYDSGTSFGGPTAWEPLLIMAAVTAVALGGAFLSLTRRDV